MMDDELLKNIINCINSYGDLLEKHNELLLRHDEIINQIYNEIMKDKLKFCSDEYGVSSLNKD